MGVGRGGFRTPADDLDFGNSGTGARLMMGLVGGHDVSARFVGDASLSSRPMERVLKPLREMGVDGRDRAGRAAAGGDPGREAEGDPLCAAGGFGPGEVGRSCWPGLRAEGVTVVEEKEATRDHTERMLRAFGVEVGVEERAEGGPVVSVRGGQSLRAIKGASVAGDPSSAAFAIALALIAGEGGRRVTGMLDNRTRTGFFDAARADGR